MGDWMGLDEIRQIDIQIDSSRFGHVSEGLAKLRGRQSHVDHIQPGTIPGLVKFPPENYVWHLKIQWKTLSQHGLEDHFLHETVAILWKNTSKKDHFLGFPMAPGYQGNHRQSCGPDSRHFVYQVMSTWIEGSLSSCWLELLIVVQACKRDDWLRWLVPLGWNKTTNQFMSTLD